MIKIKKIKVDIKKLVTMAEMGLGVVRPLNKEKRVRIKKLKKRPTEIEMEKISQKWRPYRSTVANVLWASYD